MAVSYTHLKELNGMKGVHRQAKELLDSIGCKINTYTPVSYTHLDVYKRQTMGFFRLRNTEQKKYVFHSWISNFHIFSKILV